MLINNLLSISKIEMGSINIERKRVRLRDLLQDAFDACARNGKEKNIDFHLDLPKEISPVALDKDLMRVAINNLLTNAIKYSDPGGAISMSVEETDMTVRVSVKDNGVGIAWQHIPHLTERFYRVDVDRSRESGGTGLGLAIVKHVLHRHEARLNIESVLGKGSTFSCKFPPERVVLTAAEALPKVSEQP